LDRCSHVASYVDVFFVASLKFISPLKILDLRERGSETVALSEGTGIAAFTTKSGSQLDSPYSPAGHRNKEGRRNNSRGFVSTVSTSGVVLTTLGTIHPDHLELGVQQEGVEMEDIRIGVDLEILSAAIGGDDGEPLSDLGSQEGSPAPAYSSLNQASREGKTLNGKDEFCHDSRISQV